MREYKFRGKCVERDKWVYGCYIKGIQEDEAYILKNHNGYWSWGDVFFDVYPETVGQFTGLKDKNGKEIYEGDILSIDCYSYTEPEGDAFGEVTITVYGNALIVTKDSGETECFYLSDLRGTYTTIYEVFGNIHDNPELLKEVE